jgi:putative peptide zinc metalloprotease protein
VSAHNGRAQRLWPQEEDLVAILAPTRERAESDGTVEPRRPRPPRLTAADFTPERMLRVRGRPPEGAWQRAFYRLSAGKVAPGPGAAELRRRELIARVRTPIAGCRRVAFVSRKGGVGKTTTCLLVGHTFASHRGDRVLALDANPDAGTLGHRLRRETAHTLAGLLRERQAIHRYADLRAYTSQAASGLEVVAGDERSEIAQALRGSDVGRAVAVLERHFNLLCLDTAAGVLGPATQGVLAAADQLVVVSTPGLDTARAASATLDWLEDHGHAKLVASAVAVLNEVRHGRSAIDLDRIEEHFAARCRACIRVPWDRHLDTGAEVDLEQLRPPTREAYLELAAAIARGFTEPAARRS